MSYLCIVVLAMVGSSLAAPTGDCAGGYKNGEMIERGYYFYECQGGQILPKGCVVEDQRRLALGDTVDRKNYRLKCQLDNQNGISLTPVACVHMNQDHAIGQEWQDEKNFYTCESSGDKLAIVNLGCVSNGKRVPMDKEIVDGEFVYVCKPTVNKGSRLEVNGCSQDGKQVTVGQTYESGEFFFNCTRFGAKPAGCMHNGNRLNDGDRFHEDDVTYECVIENARKEIIAVGCAQHDTTGTIIQRRLGCYFVDGPVPQQFEFNCLHDKANNKAYKVKVRCNYRVGNGVHNIEPGCFRKVDDKLVGCVKSGDDLKYSIFGADQESAAASAGLRLC